MVTKATLQMRQPNGVAFDKFETQASGVLDPSSFKVQKNF